MNFDFKSLIVELWLVDLKETLKDIVPHRSGQQHENCDTGSTSLTVQTASNADLKGQPKIPYDTI
jgi:hypothetical protein